MWAVADQVMGLYERTYLQPVHVWPSYFSAALKFFGWFSWFWIGG
jgi:hypothetical protein